MAVRNVARGGGKAFKASVTGLKDLERKLKALSADNPELLRYVQLAAGNAAAEVRDEMKAQARSAGWSGQRIKLRGGQRVTGDDAIASIFSYGQPKSGGPRTRISALAGITKKRTMVEWRAGKNPKSPRAKVAPGNLVAMAFATMLEFGTSKMRARPAIRTAVQTAKARVIDRLTRDYNALLEHFAQ